ncbi:MAG: isoprenyl transferase [Chthoniobacterales bacterium]
MQESTLNKPPRHIAVIMDGNGRWAKQRGFPRLEGHRRGAQSVRQCLEGCIDAGVEYLTLYAFSTENWKRPADEVGGLMRLLQEFLRQETKLMIKEGVRLQTIGRLSELPEACQKQIELAIEQTAGGKRITLILALSYSGRAEIVDAVKKIVGEVREGKVSDEEITEEFLSSKLYTGNFPDPDLLIRTSGEMRLSNFLLWQLSYTELHVTPKLWPDFKKEDLLEAIKDYQNRHRRFGGV